MRGEILHYDVSQGIGFISAQDGSRYMFSRNDLQQAQRVGKGTQVDFRADGQNAREVFIVDPRGPQQQVPRQSVPEIAASGAPVGAPSAQAPAAPPAYTSTASAGAPDMSVWAYFVYCCTTGYANFRDRARRKEYWSFTLFYILSIFAAVAVGMAIDGAIGNMDAESPIVTGILGGLTVLFFFVPIIAVTVRRFHDVGLSGWLYLLFLVLSFIYIGSIIIFVISLIGSQKHDNKWGPVPAGVNF